MQYNECQIRSKSAIVYTQYAAKSNSTSFQSAAQIQLKLDQQIDNANKILINSAAGSREIKKPYSGQMTKGSKKRMTKAVSLLVQSSKMKRIYNPVTHRYQYFQLSFITLTLACTSENFTAKDAHKMLLEPFLLYLRRKHQVKNYVWKAELQERGQVHYHITIDKFVLYTDLRDKWNALQDQYGLLDDYRAKYGNKIPNSTDVHSIKRVKNIEAYLVKYISKDVSSEYGNSVGGKVWDCNMSLKKGKYYSTPVTYEMERTIQYIQDSKIGEVIHFEFFTLITFKDQNAVYLLNPRQRAEYETHIDAIRIS